MSPEVLQLLQVIAYGLVLIGLTWNQARQQRSQQKHNAATVAAVSNAVAAVPVAVGNQIAGPLNDLRAVISIMTDTFSVSQTATQKQLEQIPSLLADNQNWKTLYDDQLRERTALVNRLSDQATQIAGLLDFQTSTKVNLQKIDETIEGLHTDLAEAKKKIEALEIENGTLREALGKSVVSYQASLTDANLLHTQLNAANILISDLQKQLDVLAVEFKSYRDERHAERNEWTAKLQSFEGH